MTAPSSSHTPIQFMTTPQPGDVLRLWTGRVGIAHDVLVGFHGEVFENSGPGGCVRRSAFSDVLQGRSSVELMNRAKDRHEAASRVERATRLLGREWSLFYNCQSFTSDVSHGVPISDQVHVPLLAIALLFGGAFLANRP